MVPLIGLVVVVYAIARLITLPAFIPPQTDLAAHRRVTTWVVMVGIVATLAIGWLGLELLRVSAPDRDPKPMNVEFDPKQR